MITAQELKSPAVSQAPAPYAPTQAPAPYAPYGVTQALDISQLINSILPIFMLMMVFGMLMPMMREMSGAFKTAERR